ncbi:MAG: 50S ribosomal protein L6 [Caldicoprobacterales bacterium]|jgi:large subunit ribosomal protein L6|nr:50S ribosomal protein L6 [Clostridia bacterium]MDI9511531.1 50S ribosomal protein L6 [Bacillota bacterium]NLH58307.1 50S ribosomal protein L6 [Clostridiales bacterium]
MSRIGKMPIELPDKVTITVDDDNLVTVKGPKGELSQQIHKDIKVVVEDGQIKIERPSNSKPHRSLHGLSRSLINNMVEGVVNGFKKKLEINGVGYRAQKQGKTLVLNVGYSHPVEIEEEDGIEFEVPAANQVIVSGIDKQRVGAVAAVIRGTRPPEPYKGKGIKYEDERIIRKEGKTAN